jgi:hypothetical protein
VQSSSGVSGQITVKNADKD